MNKELHHDGLAHGLEVMDLFPLRYGKLFPQCKEKLYKTMETEASVTERNHHLPVTPIDIHAGLHSNGGLSELPLSLSTPPRSTPPIPMTDFQIKRSFFYISLDKQVGIHTCPTQSPKLKKLNRNHEPVSSSIQAGRAF